MKGKRPTLSFLVANVQTQRRGGADTGGRHLGAGAVCLGFPALGVWAFSMTLEDLPGGPVVKSPPADAGAAGDRGWTPGFRRSPGGGNGNPLQDSCLENPTDRGQSMGSQRPRHNWARTHNTRFQTTVKKQPRKMRCEQKNRHFTSECCSGIFPLTLWDTPCYGKQLEWKKSKTVKEIMEQTSM